MQGALSKDRVKFCRAMLPALERDLRKVGGEPQVLPASGRARSPERSPRREPQLGVPVSAPSLGYEGHNILRVDRFLVENVFFLSIDKKPFSTRNLSTRLGYEGHNILRVSL